MKIHPPTPATPGLWKLGAAAQMAGMSAAQFEAASARGDIPVQILKIGQGGYRYVRAAELQAFLQGNAPVNQSPARN